MKKHINFAMFIVLTILVIVLAISAYLLWVEFPRGYHADRAMWVDIHKWCGLGLGIAVVMHILLHFKWLWGMVKYYFRRVASIVKSKAQESSSASVINDEGMI